MNDNAHRQMSDSFLVAAFVVLSGGLQDAYTYFCRSSVFANAQTGNIVLFFANLFEGNLPGAVRYAVPVIAFFGGIFVAEAVHRRLKMRQRIHWRQLILAFEVLLLAIVGFIPQEYNPAASALVSFSCAMQVQAFRTVHGYGYASTMCIGNLRSGAEALCAYCHDKREDSLRRAWTYFSVITMFGLGAGAGAVLTKSTGEHAIWCSCLLLSVAILLMCRDRR